MENAVARIIVLIVVIVLILVFALMVKGIINLGFSKTTQTIQKASSLGNQELSKMERELILSSTRFIISYKYSGTQRVLNDEVTGYESYLTEMSNLGIDALQPENKHGMHITSDTVIQLYLMQCKEKKKLDYSYTVFWFKNSQLTVRIVVEPPQCSNSE